MEILILTIWDLTVSDSVVLVVVLASVSVSTNSVSGSLVILTLTISDFAVSDSDALVADLASVHLVGRGAGVRGAEPAGVGAAGMRSGLSPGITRGCVGTWVTTRRLCLITTFRTLSPTTTLSPSRLRHRPRRAILRRH